MYFDNAYLNSELKQIENDLILWQETLDLHENKKFVFLNIVNLLKRKSKLENLLTEGERNENKI